MTEKVMIIGLLGGSKRVECVCETIEEAREKVAYLSSCSIQIPTRDDKIWRQLGVGFFEAEILINELEKLKDIRESNPISYTILKDNKLAEKAPNTIRVQVIGVSSKNYKQEYVHTIRDLDWDGSPDTMKVYKVTLPAKSKMNSVHEVNMDDFKVVTRPANFSYEVQGETHYTSKQETWLFIKHPHE
ncbi:hypothetical protein GZH53_15735 [Flavihumibacter sp. R14]|nr:hypothetical protein [Flavihumibacter soli]